MSPALQHALEETAKIHFQTPSREKYEAVQEFCREQIGHCKFSRETESDYISRDEARNAISKDVAEKWRKTSWWDDRRAVEAFVYGANVALDAISNLPAADVVPKDFHERCLQIEIQKRMALKKDGES